MKTSASPCPRPLGAPGFRNCLAALLGCLSVACGARDDGSAQLELAPAVLCAEPSGACLNVGAESLDVAAVPVLYKRIVGHPMVALQISIDGGGLSGAQQWTETVALGLMGAGGSVNLGPVNWPQQLLHLGAVVAADGNRLDYSIIGGQAPLPHWREVWHMLTAAVERPYSNNADLESLRGFFVRRYESEMDAPESAADTDAWSRVFHGQSYNLPRESQADLKRIDIAALRQSWSGLRDTTRWLVTLVGDLERAEVEQAVRELTDAAANSQKIPALVPANAAANTETTSDAEPSADEAASAPQDPVVLDYPASPTWHIVSYFTGPAANGSDYAALDLALRVLDQRLFTEVRDIRGLAYTTGARLTFTRQTFGRFWLTTDSPLQALPIVRAVAADLRANGPNQRELETARAALRTEILVGSSTVAGQASLLSDWQMTAGSRQGVDDMLGALDSVSAADLSAALSYLDGAKTTAAGPAGALTAADLSSLFGNP